MRDLAAPVRTCTGCRRARPKSELWRLALSSERQRVTLDAAGQRPGRGAYVCRDSALRCLEAARRRRSLSRSLRLSDHHLDYGELHEELAAVAKEESASPP
ncbi:MAG TPA: YlxR family protein [Candidatus Sulfotelmatobacter sp.]|nr:YlxR family protein [Candidatus Sulfotelmatobacter sp.]